MEKDNDRCIVCGKKIKYGAEITRIPYKGKVLFVLDELIINFPEYKETIKRLEQQERLARYLNLIDKKEDEIEMYKSFVPNTNFMSEFEWIKWFEADEEKYSTEKTLPAYRDSKTAKMADVLNKKYCSDKCFKKHYRQAQKAAKKHIYKQSEPKFADQEKTKEYPVKELRQKLLEKNSECHVCEDDRSLEIHHIIPKEYGGKDIIGNTLLLCPTCHNLAHSKGVLANE